MRRPERRQKKRTFHTESLEPRLTLTAVTYVSAPSDCCGQLAVEAFDLGDVDGDGLTDILAADADSLTWHRNLGHGRFDARTIELDGYGELSAVVLGDVNRDDDLDIVFTDSHRLAWLENVGDGRFGPPQEIPRAEEVTSSRIAVADLNSDGDIDLLANSANGLIWYENLGRGRSFSNEREFASSFAFADFEVADFDVDGDVDVIVADRLRTATLENQGDGRFEPIEYYPSLAESVAASVADINADGNPDVIGVDPTEGLLAWHENRDVDSLGAVHIMAQLEGELRAVVADDLDDDGDIDLAVLAGRTPTLTWYENTDGLGGFRVHPIAQAGVTGTSFANVDIDADGDVDFLVGEQLSWHENRLVGDANNDGTFDSEDLVFVLSSGKYLDLVRGATFDEGDWNHDGVFDDRDIVTAFLPGHYQGVATHQPVISEFLARNQGGLEDDDDNSPDWIEIYNPGHKAVNLRGYRLTDRPDDRTRWTFPNLRLGPRQFLVVFASGRETQDQVDTAGNLHASFSLRGAGEYVALVAPNGEIVSEYGSVDQQYPPQVPNVSYGFAQSVALIDANSPSMYWVPTSTDLDEVWTSQSFEAAANGFITGTTSLGYETEPDDRTNFSGRFTTELPAGTTGLYTRMEFHLDDPSAIDTLSMRLISENGFVAYLNGERVADLYPPSELHAFSMADRNRSDASLIDPRQYDLTAFRNHLVNGKNVLAIHAMNHERDLVDMLLVAELTAGVSDVSAAVGEVARVGYLATPTPGTHNVLSSELFDGFVGGVVNLDQPRGIYDDPINVQIRHESPGTTIVFTTDGTLPSITNGTKVLPADERTAPFTQLNLASTTTIRAAAFRDRLLSTKVATHTYLFPADIAHQPEIDPDVRDTVLPGYEIDDALVAIPTISVVMDPDDLFDRSDGIYANPTQRWQRSASVEMIDFDSHPDHQIDVGLAIHGATSRNAAQKPFRLLFQGEFGPTTLTYPLFPNSDVDVFDLLILRASSTDTWQSGNGGVNTQQIPRWQTDQALYLRDQWVRDTLLELGHPQAHGRFVHLYLNGEYWGLYNLTERPTDSFNAEHFGGDKRDYDVTHDRGEVQAGSLDVWNEMFELAEAGFESDDAYQRFLGNHPDGTRNPNYPVYIDEANFIDYIIVNIFFGAEDWHDHNYWAARQQGPDSEGFRFFSWDQENIIDSLEREDPWVTDTMAMTDEEVENASGALRRSPIWLNGKLRQNPTYARKFADRLHALVFNDGPLTAEPSFERLMRRAREIDQAVVAQSARWGDVVRRNEPYKREVEWLAELDRLQNEYFPQTLAYGLPRFVDVGLYPSVPAPRFNQHGGNASADFRLSMENPGDGGTIYYTLDGTDPRLPNDDVNASAVPYRGNPLTLPADTVRVRARVLLEGTWSALNEADFTVMPGTV